MDIDFDVYKGSANGSIHKETTHRELGDTEAIVQLTHSGVCGTDEHYLHQDMGLGHEGVGIVKEVGRRVRAVKVGDRVGFGWVQYYCGQCEPCLTGLDSFCLNRQWFGGHNHDQSSFGTHVCWDESALHLIPEGMASEYAGPMMCGGATVWGALSQYGARPTDRIGVVGIGGLGHLAIQFAAAMGCEVVAFSSTESKKEEAMKFGATEFVATEGLTKLEGVKPIKHLLLCGSAQPDYNLYLPIMAAGGVIYPLTISFDASPVPMLQMVISGLRIQGSPGAYRSEIRRMLQFAVQHDIHPTIVTWPMNKQGVEDSMKTLREGKMRYRGVLVAQ